MAPVAQTTVETPSVNGRASSQHSSPSLQVLVHEGKVTQNELFLSGIAGFIENVQALVADDNNHYNSGRFPLVSTFRSGVQTAYDQLWPIMVEMTDWLNQNKEGKRTPSEDERFIRLSEKLGRALCYAHGLLAVERMERAIASNTTKTQVKEDFSAI